MKNELGFTLIEMLVVVLIIGILASIALPQYQNAKIKADFTEAYIKLKAVAQIEQMCRLQNGVELCDGELHTSLENEICREINNLPYDSCVAGDAQDEGLKFYYDTNSTNLNALILARAQYLKEDVCVCITKDYNFVLTQGECTDTPSKDYSKILGIPDVTEENDDYGCSCC